MQLLESGLKVKEYELLRRNCWAIAHQPSDRVSRLTNHWIGLKFGLSVPDILSVDLNGGDGFGSQEDPVLGPEQQLGLGGVSFYLSFVGVAIVCSLLTLVV
ncbi:hypothetical protein MTR67_042383 [Solanum verrucosum]|uniref:Uncharacterized protein n=1 Tax=Solanum verrucosum TaxID=315347 RepID=A0AAF0ULU4_SOLVR|nr:hypothetical protein MTR67_042383 [Solanum verrucosum]